VGSENTPLNNMRITDMNNATLEKMADVKSCEPLLEHEIRLLAYDFCEKTCRGRWSSPGRLGRDRSLKSDLTQGLKCLP
jgi:hypothetical protein